ncbi:hypothetical protein BDF22DRAFT_383203 [Syncephalis plumigaleata]|nr:hypothetical protein BDF22DRAFT_383203 [Syncephalis plumigaleata]
MYQFIIRYCLFFIVYCLIYHTARVASDLTVFDDKKPITFSTLDYFAYNRSYYTHAGQAISWTWANNTSNCTLGPLDENLKKIANDSSADLESNFAIVTSINDAKQAGCTTIREIGHAVEEISKQLTSLRQPKVDLLIVTVITASPTLYWGPGSYGYYSAKSPGRVENPPPIDIALLDQNVSREFYKLDQLKKGHFAIRPPKRMVHGTTTFVLKVAGDAV